MKAMIIESFGGISAVKKADLPIPTPDDHEVQIKIAYAAVNPVDWKICEGLLQKLAPHEFPIILGWDFSGVVTQTGKTVKSSKVGDKVIGFARKDQVHDGTFAEYITLSEQHIAPMPPLCKFSEAAAIPLVSLTAWQALYEFANLSSHETILIHAGAGGVGSIAIQLAKLRNAKIITTASRKNHGYVRELGANQVIDYTSLDFVEVVRRDYPKGIDVVLDCVGGTNLKRSATVLKPGGCLVSIVENPFAYHKENKDIRSGFVFVRPEPQQLAAIGQLIETKQIYIPQISELPLGDSSTALDLSKSGHTRGKIVLRVKT